ncbi:MAG: ImmA/IrrE family metallo-endopeptidase [Chitinophagaceae bacterium]|nr:ImmA/IrrE family metallo-endopeptidase [Chitinophagaceae bacterium]
MDILASKDIDKLSFDILRASKSFDIYPTPVDQILNYSELIISNQISLKEIHQGYFEKATDALFKAVAKLRGVFDRSTKTIYIDQELPHSKKNFVKLHEVGHGVIPWQMKSYEVIEDDDDSISHHTIEEFEKEANYFASITLFQHDRFNDQLAKLNLGIDSAMYLSKLYGASIHATLRRYVECSTKRCALIVLSGKTSEGFGPECLKRDLFFSEKFAKTFGSLELPNEFCLSWNFVKHHFSKRRGIIDGELTLSTKNGFTEFKYHFFNNTYNSFVLLFPSGEKQTSRTKIILQQAI